ncbi:MAG TPA: hypothetical protein VIF82_18915 [Burkholderiaceae bacterium]|jgi:hypothetical protein
MSKPISAVTPQKKNGLQEKLLALYDLNKSYISEAENFLSKNSKKLSGEYRKESLRKEDIDRLYSHIFVLEHIAKLLHEEFLTNKNGGLPERPNHDSDRRIKQIHK